MCADMITSMPASIAAMNGARIDERSDRVSRTTGRRSCESIMVTPWPGKCLATDMIPERLAPRT